MPASRLALLIALAPLPLVASCGGGTVAIGYLVNSGKSGSSNRNSPTVISDVQVASDPKSSPLSIQFRLTDAESTPLSVDLLVIHPGGAAENMLLSGSPSETNLTALATSPAGVDYVRKWDFASQLPSGTALATGLQVMVRRQGDNSGPTSSLFDVGNDAPTVGIVDVPTGEISGPVAVDLLVKDSSSDLVDVAVQYCDMADPTTWKTATPLGTDLQRIAATPAGTAALFLWNVQADEPQRDFTARLRFTPTDLHDAGAPVDTTDLAIDNNASPTLLVDGSGFFADPDARRGIPVRYRLLDAEGDPLRVVFQWAKDQASFPALPTTPAAIDAILASPDLRRQFQIATERPVAYGGRLDPVSSDTVELQELASTANNLLSGFVVGRSLEILSIPSPPAGRASGWSSDPLVAPVAAVPYLEGDHVLVLDRPAPSNWRLRELDLATGSIVRDLASGADGDPSALALSADRTSVLIAADVAGAWTLFEILVADGSRAAFLTADATVPAGTVRGLVSTGHDTALLTVADALVKVDRTPPGPAFGRTLFSGLSGPWGIALDPRHSSRLYLAEASWVDPATSTVEGRVSIFDLLTQTRVDLVSNGLKLSRPEAIAIERDGARLLAVVDANPADTSRELRAVDLGNGGGGDAFQISAGLALDVAGLATGGDDLRILAFPSQNDLATGGGVQQIRTIVADDLTSGQVKVAAPFTPALDPRQTWRIRDLSSPIPAGGSDRSDTFVWDSSDIPAGGDVVLRGTPYDSEAGLSTDTGVPRTVRAGLDVAPLHIGGSGSTTAVAGLDVADLDGDGDLDVVSANSGADSATIFFQDRDHAFPTAPSTTLLGSTFALMTQPVAVIAADLDRDGDSDLAIACHGSNDLVIARQVSKGSFTVAPSGLTGIAGPTDLVAADLNNDKRIDLACSNDAGNNLAIWFQQPLGFFNATPSAYLGTATTLAPSGIAAGDLDADGDVDLVASLRGSNQIAIFRQTGAGNFPVAPSQLLGGAGLTDGPEAVRIFDVNRDGRPDLVSANKTGNCVTIFLQQKSGFLPQPTYTLASSGGPVSPADVALGDVNADGSPDVVATSASDSIFVFLSDPASGSFASDPLILRGADDVTGPVAALLDDLNGDGQIDLASADQGGNDIALFFQLGGRSFTAQSPELVLGSATETPDVQGVAVADLDGDGDFDLASVNAGDGTVTLFQQIAPAVFSTHSNVRLGGGPATAGASAIAAADWSRDGRVDLLTANRTAKSLAGYVQRPDGTFSATPDLLLASGLIDPISVALADLDGDDALDIACADFGGGRVALFHQAPNGSFPSAPDTLLGSPVTTNGPSMVLAADLNGDGRIDLATANKTGNTVTLFFQQPGGAFNASPDLTLGSAATTNGPVVVAAADLNGDGLVDLACANQAGNNVTIFFASAPGVFPAVPSLVLTHPSLQGPTGLSLEDVDLDGSRDVVVGCSTSDSIVIFFQVNPGVFPTAEVIGSSTYTKSPVSLSVVDLDGDGDQDLVSAQPELDNVPVFFGAH